MTRHGRLGSAALALLATLIFASSASAAVINQQVQWSGGNVTWTGGDSNSPNPTDDAVTITEASEPAGQITIHTTSSAKIDLFDATTDANCDYGDAGDDSTTVICDNVTHFSAGGALGNDTVDASGLTSIAATLNGNDGDDTLSSGGGADHIDGDAGNDTISGGAGDDDLYAGADDDSVHGGDGNDYINGDGATNGTVVQASTDGNDTLDGDDGIDEIRGGGGGDTINGGAGDDAVQSGQPSGGLYGDAGNDTINGGDGTDYADGGADDDLINGDAGDDRTTCFFGGPIKVVGTDECYFILGGLDGGSGNDAINGGDGSDTARGGSGNDVIHGDAGDDGKFGIFFNLCLGPCNSSLDGGTGTDVVNGDAGDDVAQGGPDDDVVNGGDGSDRLYGDCAFQKCSVCSGDCGTIEGTDTLNGDAGDDELTGEGGPDTMNGGDGDDNVYEDEDAAADTANGGPGADDLYYSSGGNPVSITLDDVANDGEAANPDAKDPGDPGNNYMSDMDNVHYYDECGQCVTGNATTPVTIVGTAAQNLLFGSSGDDDITGGAGADYMSGGDGADTFHARDGFPDYVDCDGGVDTAIVDQWDTVHNCENVDPPADVPSAFDTSQPPPSPPTPPAGAAGNKPDLIPPTLGLDVPKTTFTAEQLVLGVKVSFSCNEDCKLNLRLLAQQSSGSATFSRVKGYNVVVGRKAAGFGKSKRNLKVRPCERKPGGPQSKACLKRFKKALNARLAKTGKVTMKLIAVTEDRAGNRSQKTKTITIRKRVR